MAGIRVSCWNCKAKYRADDRLSGKTAKCPKCGSQMRILPIPDSVFVAAPEPELDDDPPIIVVERPSYTGEKRPRGPQKHWTKKAMILFTVMWGPCMFAATVGLYLLTMSNGRLIGHGQVLLQDGGLVTQTTHSSVICSAIGAGCILPTGVYAFAMICLFALNFALGPDRKQ